MARLDLISPFLNEAQTAKAFTSLIAEFEAEVARRFGLTVHKILIDDGSTDGSAEIFAKGLTGSWEIVRLSRNFGKEVAVLAGLDRVGGDYVLIMDADLQHSNEIGLKLLTELLGDPAVDVVYAKTDRSDSSWRRSQLARVFYRLINSSQRFDIPANAGDFRAMRAPVAHAIAKLRDKRRFNKGLYAWAGFRQKAVIYSPEPRAAGSSKWSRLDLFAFSLEALTSFSAVPLRILTLFGLLTAMGGALVGVKVLFEVLVYGIAVPGYPSLLVAVVVLGGLNLALLGLVGEYVWVAVSESKDRPVYVVRDVISAPETAKPAAERETSSA
jgi:glycosyltransferase involved in cell wall biosynthesis